MSKIINKYVIVVIACLTISQSTFPFLSRIASRISSRSLREILFSRSHLSDFLRTKSKWLAKVCPQFN